MLQAGWLFFFWNLSALASPDLLAIHGNLLVDLSVIGASILGLLLPAKKSWPFFLFAQVAVPFYFMPMVGNNVTVRAVIVFSLFLNWLWISARKANTPSILAIIKANASSLRIGLLLIYFIAGIHKLNADFVRPEISCVRTVLERVFLQPGGGTHGFAPSWLVELGIYLTLVLELFLPSLLFCRRLRPWACGALVGFHTLLGMNYLDFSLTQFGFLCLFVPGPVLAQWTRRIRPITPKRAIIWSLLVLTGIFHHFSPWLEPRAWIVYLIRLVPVLWIIGVLYAFTRAGLFRDFFKKRQPIAVSRPNAFLWATLIVLVFLGLAPYYGLRTWATLSMFSNLRVQNGNNHFFLPSASFFPDSKSLIEIDKTDNVFLQRTYIEGSRLLTKIDLERFMVLLLRRGKSSMVSYHRIASAELIGPQINSSAAIEAESFHRRPFWQKRIMGFRPIPKDSSADCQW